MLRMLFRSMRNLSTKMYMLADDLGLIDAESIYSNEMKRVCGKVGCIAESIPMAMGNVRRPPVDIMETDEALIVTLELPGVEKESIELTAVDDELTVNAKRKAEPESGESTEKGEQGYYIFKRNIKLPCDIKSEQAKASLNNGLLTINLPKANATIRNRIAVE